MTEKISEGGLFKGEHLCNGEKGVIAALKKKTRYLKGHEQQHTVGAAPCATKDKIRPTAAPKSKSRRSGARALRVMWLSSTGPDRGGSAQATRTHAAPIGRVRTQRG